MIKYVVKPITMVVDPNSKRQLEFDIEEAKKRELEFEIQMAQGGGSDIPAYGGPYTVYPSSVAQVLQTLNKRMTDNVTVTAISYTEVENEAGGLTAIIGGTL